MHGHMNVKFVDNVTLRERHKEKRLANANEKRQGTNTVETVNDTA
jgi:hypothetical protein